MKKITISEVVILFLVLLSVIVLMGCKPKQIVAERTVVKVDSSAILALQDLVAKKSVENANLCIRLQRLKNENTLLQSEVSSKTTKYDTDKPIIPETGKPPVSEETQTESKTSIERQLSEIQIDNRELRKENTSLTILNSNLKYENRQLRDENSELKSKTFSQTAFSFKLSVWSFAIGLVVGAFAWLKLGNIIKKIWKK